jgi:hypothetical protein
MDLEILISLIFLFSIINLSSQSITIDCDFNTKWTYQILGSIYRCEVKNNINITSADEANIEKFTGKHISGYYSSNVNSFDIRNKVVNYFPQEIQKLFPSINSILINDCQLKQLHQKDIKPFQSLKILDLQGNEIAILEDGIFDSNTNLQYVWLARNKILHVDINVFTMLTSLSRLSFYKNKCSEDKDSAYDSTSVKNLIAEISKTCNNHYYLKLNDTLRGLQKELKTLKIDNFEAYSTRLKELDSNFKSSNFSYFTTFQNRIEDIENDQKFTAIQNHFNLKKRIDDLELIKIADKLKEIKYDMKIFETMNFKTLAQKVDVLENKLDDFIKTIDEKIKTISETIGVLEF